MTISVSQVYPSQWVSPDDVSRPFAVTIAAVTVEEFRRPDGTKDPAPPDRLRRTPSTPAPASSGSLAQAAPTTSPPKVAHDRGQEAREQDQFYVPELRTKRQGEAGREPLVRAVHGVDAAFVAEETQDVEEPTGASVR